MRYMNKILQSALVSLFLVSTSVSAYAQNPSPFDDPLKFSSPTQIDPRSGGAGNGFVAEIAVNRGFYAFKLSNNGVPSECPTGHFYITDINPHQDAMLSQLISAKVSGLSVSAIRYRKSLDNGYCHLTQINTL